MVEVFISTEFQTTVTFQTVSSQATTLLKTVVLLTGMQPMEDSSTTCSFQMKLITVLHYVEKSVPEEVTVQATYSFQIMPASPVLLSVGWDQKISKL